MNQNSIFIKLNGVGWNMKFNNEKQLILNVGYSQPVKIDVPGYLEVKIQPGDIILNIKYLSKSALSAQSDKGKGNGNSNATDVSLMNLKEIHNQRQKVGDFAAMLRRIRPWNIYTGQGIVRRDRVDNLVRRRGKRS